MLREKPEEILERMGEEEKKKARGRLKIFFGYAAGVGKTYAMLQAAQEAKAAGIDVAAGYIEPHARPETMALCSGLEQLAPQRGSYRGLELSELDLDGVLQRRPQLVLVDELAHTNAPFCRHAKRFQDVDELLRAGIDVYTTLNVQHIESLNDLVASLTGTVVQERIKDDVFDGADQVELVDIEPQELIARLQQGKVYRRPDMALENFFIPENLQALRELALRRMADRTNRLQRSVRVPIEEHILIGLSSSPSNPKVIRTAARLAKAFGGRFTALFVATSAFDAMSAENKQRLEQNIKLARSFDAAVVTVYGEDIAAQIAAYVRKARVSKVVLGRSAARSSFWSAKPTFAARLTELAPEIDIYIIPDKNAQAEPRASWGKRLQLPAVRHGGRDLLVVAASLVLCTLLGMLLDRMGIGERDIAMVYILGVLAPALLTESWIFCLLSSLLSIPAMAFFFATPRYSLMIADPGYTMTFAAMFVVSMLTSVLAQRQRRLARQAAEHAYRMVVLRETSSLLQNTEDMAGIFRVTAGQLQKILDRPVVFYDGGDFSPEVFTVPGRPEDISPYVTDSEQALAAWVYKNNKHAGAGTDTLPGARCLYLAVRSQGKVMAVAGVAAQAQPLLPLEYNVLISILDSAGLALEKEKQRAKRRKVEAAAYQEQMRANLLRAISHDLRTPLTTIAGSAELLRGSGAGISESQRKALAGDIAEDAHWLINLVENLLSATRIENGTMQLRMQPELLGDVIAEAVQHARRRSVKQPIHAELEDELMLVQADVRLLLQVFLNLIDNAQKYTPEGTEITISARKARGFAVIEVADEGKGIRPDEKEHLFDMFYTGKKKNADGRRGLGIGLSLCRTIVVAHGGSISVRDNHPHGTIFRFTLKLEEAELHG